MSPGALDWSLVQAFLAVAEHGSLSAAARVLGSTQPTLGRQIKAMEEQLGAELFQRRDKGYALTDVGTALLDAAKAMRDAAYAIELRAAAKGAALEGSVRITASHAVATHHLPKIIAEIRATEPLISLEIAPSDESSNLYYREADIAVRMYRPTQPELVTQFLGELSLAAFASQSYVARRGLPREYSELLEHDIVGMDQDTQIVDGFRKAGMNVDRDWFRVRCDEDATRWALVRAGCGIGFSQRAIGIGDPELVLVPLDFGLPRMPVWLTAHSAIRHTQRIRRVWDLLADGLRQIIAADA